MAIRPTTISAAGATSPRSPVIPTIKLLVPSLRLLKLSSILVKNSTIGVTSLINASPIGARDAFSFSMLFVNFVAADSSTLPSSLSARIASSSAVLVVSAKTLFA